MQKINTLLDQVNKELKKDSSNSLTEVGPSNFASANFNDSKIDDSRSKDIPLDRIDAINTVFAEFEFAYHNQFHKAFDDLESLTIAKKYWLSNLEEYSPSQIVAAAKKIIKNQEYLPSIAAFLKACEDGFELFGLPRTPSAFKEACYAPSPKLAYRWSHEAVYFAGKASGWFLLANEPEAISFPVFEYNYSLLAKRVMRGEKLIINQPPALTEKITRPMSKKDAKAAIAQLKKDLSF